MSLNSLADKTMYFNVNTKTVVKLLKKDNREASIATVKDGSPSNRRRSVRASLIHEGYLASDGQPHPYGYVPVTALPEDHPHAVKAPKTDWSNVDIDDLDALSDADLADLILEQERIKKNAADLADRAKVIAKGRRGSSLGIDLQGDIALVYTSGAKFDGVLARRHLAAEDYKKILLSKPDATLARKIFENEPEKLEACLKDNGPSLTVRKATDEDREKYTKSQPQSASGDEEYSFEY